MAFTYDGALATDKEKVRFYVGDTVYNTGVKPDGTNFTDEELTAVISAEGSWQRAVAAVFDVLAGLYATQVDISVGPRRESLSQKATAYAARAAQWRKQYGGSTGGVGTVSVTRVDGYSDDVAANSV